MRNHVEFKLSTGSWVGLATIAFASVAMFSASMVAFHPTPSRNQSGVVVRNVDPCDCDAGFGGLAIGSELRMPVRESAPPVNRTARDEVKQGSGIEDVKGQSACDTGNCNRPLINWSRYTQTTYQPQQVQYSQPMVIPTQVTQYQSWPASAEANALAAQMGARLVKTVQPDTNSIMVYAVLQNGMVWNVTKQVSTQAYSGVNCFLAVMGDMQKGSSNPNAINNATTPGSPIPAIQPAVQPVANPQPTAPAPSAKEGRYQLTLFLNPNDPTSQMVKQWFETNPNLKQLKANCATEEFTPKSPMYQIRMSNVVQPKDFPAILFAQPDGGHIYAVGRPMLPRDAESLLADMRTGLKLAQSVQQAPLIMSTNTSGAIKTQGYNWDSLITDNLQLVQSQDFPQEGDSCVDQDGDGECDTTGEPWYPGKRVRDLLGGNRQPGMEAVLWANASEIVQILLGVVVAILVAAIAFKLLKK